MNHWYWLIHRGPRLLKFRFRRIPFITRPDCRLSNHTFIDLSFPTIPRRLIKSSNHRSLANHLFQSRAPPHSFAIIRNLLRQEHPHSFYLHLIFCHSSQAPVCSHTLIPTMTSTSQFQTWSWSYPRDCVPFVPASRLPEDDAHPECPRAWPCALYITGEKSGCAMV